MQERRLRVVISRVQGAICARAVDEESGATFANICDVEIDADGRAHVYLDQTTLIDHTLLIAPKEEADHERTRSPAVRARSARKVLRKPR